jgi:hypothetical protein
MNLEILIQPKHPSRLILATRVYSERIRLHTLYETKWFLILMLSGSELSLVQITAFCTSWKISLYCFTSKSAKLRLLRSRRVPKQINHEIPNREFGHLYFCFVLYAEQYPGHHYFLSDLIKKKKTSYRFQLEYQVIVQWFRFHCFNVTALCWKQLCYQTIPDCIQHYIACLFTKLCFNLNKILGN